MISRKRLAKERFRLTLFREPENLAATTIERTGEQTAKNQSIGQISKVTGSKNLTIEEIAIMKRAEIACIN